MPRKPEAYHLACMAMNAAQPRSDPDPLAEHDDEATEEAPEPGTAACHVRTYFPTSFTDRVCLTEAWKRQRDEKDAQSQAAMTKHFEQQPVRTNFVGWPYRKRMPQPARSTVSELLAQQQQMAYEADVVERLRQQAEREHIKLLGRTPDLANGRMEELLQNARELTKLSPAK